MITMGVVCLYSKYVYVVGGKEGRHALDSTAIPTYFNNRKEGRRPEESKGY